MRIKNRFLNVDRSGSVDRPLARGTELLGRQIKVLVVLFLAGVVVLSSRWSELLFFGASPKAWLIVSLPAAVALAPAFFIATYVRMSNPEEKPAWLLGASFGLGAVVTVFALALNTFAVGYFEGAVLGMVMFFYLFVAPIEEALKMLAVRVYATDTKHFNTAMDCAVFGAFAGLGFAFAENIIHIVSSGFLGSGNVLGLILGRAGAGPLHVVVSAIGGYYIGRAKLAHGAGYNRATLIKGWVTVTALHATYNTLILYLATPGSLADVGGVSVQILGLIVLVAFFALIGQSLNSIITKEREKAATKKRESPGRSPAPVSD